MLNPFPSLLVYSFFVPALLRISASIVFIYMAQYLSRERTKVAALRNVPVVGKIPEWMVWVSVVITTVVAFCLFIGFMTQWAAIVGMLIALKHGLATKKYTPVLPLSRGAYVLLFILCLSLLFSGAGALAFDLPL